MSEFLQNSSTDEEGRKYLIDPETGVKHFVVESKLREELLDMNDMSDIRYKSLGMELNGDDIENFDNKYESNSSEKKEVSKMLGKIRMNDFQMGQAKKIEVGGYDVYFPYEPYDIQKNFIGKLMEA